MNSGKKPVFTVIAGINGAGKTSLYRVLKGERDLGMRINTDEIAASLGDPRDPITQFRASKQAVRLMDRYISEKTSFHVETTFSGGATQRHLKIAKQNGFYSHLYFLGVDNVEVALDRVHRRMANGGHGIADSYIISKYNAMNGRLHILLPLFDEVHLYDNTDAFRQIAVLKDGRFLDCDSKPPFWFLQLGNFSEINENNES